MFKHVSLLLGQPRSTHSSSPIVYVKERVVWQYRVLVREPSEHPPLAEDELNALGAEGWEMVTTIVQPTSVSFYFKRPG